MQSIRLHHVLFGSVLLAVLLLGGCGGGGGGRGDGAIPPGVTPIVLRIAWPSASRQAPLPAGTLQVRILVQDAGQNNLLDPVTVRPREGRPTVDVTLQVPNGGQRVFTAEALGVNRALLGRGSRAIDVGPGLPNRVVLDVGPVFDQLVVTPNPLDLFVDNAPAATSVAVVADGNPLPPGSPPGSLGYVSSNTAVATVDQNGVVSPRSVGSATVTAISGTVTGATTVHVLDFSLALSPDPAALALGTSRDVTVTATRQGGDFPITITAVNNLPPGVTANTPVVIPAGATVANVTLTAGADAATGQVQINATGTGDAGGRTATRTSSNLTLNVRNFVLTVTPDPARLPVGGAVDLTVTLLRQRSRAQGPDFDVTLTDVTGLPAGVAVSPTTPLPLTIPAGSNEATITLEAAPGATAGTAEVRVVGEISINGGTAQRTSAAVTLEVFDFSLTLSPDPTYLGRGDTADVTVDVVRQRSRGRFLFRATRQGSDFEVTITAVNGLPAQVSATNLPLTIPAGQTSGVLQLQATGQAAIGSSTITATGQADGAQRTSGVATLNTFDFSLALDRPDYTLFRPRAGQTADYNVPINLTRSGFDTNVTITALNNLPTGVTATSLPQTLGPDVTIATVTLRVTDQATVGQSTISATGEATPDGVNTAARTSSTATLDLVDYTLTLSPDPLVINQGSTSDLTLDLVRNGWTGDLQIVAMRNLPFDVTVQPEVPTAIDASQTSLVFTFQVGTATPLGDYTIEIDVEAEVTPGYVLTRTYTFTLRVEAG